MDTVKKVKILIEEIPNVVTRGIWGGPRETQLLVASFNTDAVRRISRREQNMFGRSGRLVCPAKYAVFWHEGRDDSGLIAQSLVMFKEYREKAVWFDSFYDLPYAIDELRKRFPEKTLPDSITGLIDWPLDRKKLKRGATIVSTEKKSPART